MVSFGSVRAFDAEEGWGVIDGPEVPGGCWVHFSAIEVDGYRELRQGQRVVFEAEPADQDGYAYRAVRVQVEPTHNEPPHNEPANAEPTSTKPANTKPASTKPASAEPASTEPVNGEQ